METGYTKALADKIKEQLGKVVINQENMTNFGLTAIFSGGHVLIEGLPGLAKTLWARCAAKTISADFRRVQFTSDLMPSDILGTNIFDMSRSEFTLKKGPLFTNLFLADEINRTPPKTQSALLEVMEEKSITIDGVTHRLPPPFIVFATQNPVEFEGTYPLPEAVLDRFCMKLLIDYPGVAAEKQVLLMHGQGFKTDNLDRVETVCSPEEVLRCQEETDAVTVDDGIYNYIISIVETTRRVSSVAVGASPRGSVALLLASKVYAAIQGRDFVTPDDVRDLAAPVLRHRVILKPEAEIDGLKTDKVIENILSHVKVPR
ncbi:MAG: MoxR family ATPase [Clostridiales bacterium]|jgi:MoxR-like ATPase|nr:MoxR family ATPase [Clostridiales bacterium]